MAAREDLKMRLTRLRGLELGGVREPLPALVEADMDIVKEAAQMICDAKKKYL